METDKNERPTVMNFERDPMTGSWRATARTSAGEVVAQGEALRETRMALEQLLRMGRAE